MGSCEIGYFTHTHHMYSKCYFMSVILAKEEDPKVMGRSTDTEKTLDLKP